MKREPFLALREPRWKRLESLIARSQRGLRRPENGEALDELPALYRRVCQDLAIARRRMYGREVVERLNALALASRNVLYRDRARFFSRLAHFVASEFPRQVRAEWRFFWLAAVVYLVPLVTMMLVARHRPDLLFAAMSPEQVQMFESMYDPGERVTDGRSADDSIAMFGFYVQNNVGGDIKSFAGGALWGVGTILFLFYNGLMHGSVFGHVSHIGYGGVLWPFVASHSTIELSAFFIASAAGLRVGAAMVAPGRRTRARALREDGARALALFTGAACMTVVAAVIEGFWSASAAPVWAKYSVGGALFVGTVAYFLLAGRGDEARTPRS